MNISKIIILFFVIFTISNIAHADLTTGLVAYYPFNGNANDESGNGNNGTVNGATLTTDRFGNVNSAYSFNNPSGNSSAYIEIQNNYIMSPTNKLSISLWIKPNDTLNRDLVAKEYGNSWVDSYVFWSRDGKLMFDLYNGINVISINWSPSNFMAWHHVVGVWDGSTMRMYGDGIERSSNAFSGPIYYDNHVIYIGADDNNGDGVADVGWNGILDEVRFYNRALSASEIQQLYNEGTNKSPTISSFTATPKFGNPPLTVNFNVAANDPDGSIASYQWDFYGDGSIDDTTTTGTTSHIYNGVGTFNASVTVVDNQGAKQKSSAIPITVQYETPNSTARLINISTRGQVGTNLENMIAGFAVGGSGNLKLVMRALGKGLNNYGVATNLNPKFDVLTYPARNPISYNYDWETNNREIKLELERLKQAPPHVSDAATILNMSPGVYTTEVSPSSSENGIGIVEVFEAEPSTASNARLINISTRSFVGAGLQNQIAGFAINGSGTLKLAARALGQGLVASGVATNLDARIQIYTYPDRRLIADNDSWQFGPSVSELQSKGINPPHVTDAALILNLAAGAYTVEVVPVNTYGIGLIELFEVAN